jgi:hypothetical protein
MLFLRMVDLLVNQIKRRGRHFSGRLTSWSTKLNDEDIVFPEG